MLVLSPLDLTGNELRNAVIQVLASDPGSPVEGQIWYNSTTHAFMGRINGSSVSFGSGGFTQEQIEDFLGTTTLVGSSKLTVTYNDGAGTITFAVTGLVPGDITGFDTQVRTNRLDQMATPTADVAMGSHKLTGLTDGSSAQDAVTLSQLQAVQQGIDWKQSVRVASTANIAVASALVNASTIDGVAVATGDRVLLKNQTTASENGVYIVAAAGAASRSVDADSSADVTGGFAVWVNEGTTQADTGWVLTTNDPIVLATTSLVFTQFSGLGQITAGAGLTKTGATLDVVGGTGITVAADLVSVDTAVVVRKFAVSVGDGAALTYNVDHNLATLDVTVEVYRVSDGVRVMCDVTHSTTNRVIVGFTIAPTTNQYRVVVHG